MESHGIVSLVQAALNGDREAFGELIERHQDMVYAVCYRIAGNPADAEDLAHDAFVEAFLKLGRLAAPERFSGWLRTVTRNVCLMWLRRHVPMEEFDETEAPPPAEEEADEARVQALAAMTGLRAAQRLILVLHYWERMSYEEIGHFLGVPIGTVMSRMHRARAALRERMDEGDSMEELDMRPEVGFREEVDAELAVLLRMSRHGGRPVERLRAMLEHSPDRLTDLIRDTEDPALPRDLGRAMRHLGSLGFGPILKLYASADEAMRMRAFAVLEAALSKAGDATVSVLAGTPRPHAYMIADAIITAEMDDGVRAELLVELLETRCRSSAAAMLTCVLMGYPDAASRILLERFATVRGPAELYRRGHTFYALLRTGPNLCAELVKRLDDGDTSMLRVATAAAEGLARSLHTPWLRDATPRQFAEDQRRRVKWTPLKQEAFAPELLTQLGERLRRLTEHADGDIRNRAVCALGLLGDEASAEALRAAAQHTEVTTRVTALQALADLGDDGCGGMLVQAAREEDRSVRIAAIEALGRLTPPEATAVLSELVRDPDRGVQTAAITAVGELPKGEGDAILRELIGSADRQAAKAAAKALYRQGRNAPEPSERSRRLAELRARRVQKIRGDARPVTHNQPDAALRFAFPEVRPYSENEATRLIAGVCGDYSSVRRLLIHHGFMTREEGRYEFTELGKAAWRVEHFVLERYLMRDPAHSE